MTAATAKKPPRRIPAKASAGKTTAAREMNHRTPIEEEKDYIVLGYGRHQDNCLPSWSHMESPRRIEMMTKSAAMEELRWQRKNNPEYDVRVFRLEPVAFSRKKGDEATRR